MLRTDDWEPDLASPHGFVNTLNLCVSLLKDEEG